MVGGSKVFFLSARLLLLTLFSYFSALAVNSVIAAWLALPPSALRPEDNLPPPVPQSKPPLSAYAVVYSRDLFNSVKAPPQADGVAVAASSGTLTLWGTAVRDRDRAFAIIEDQGTHVQGLYREGDTIAPGITLAQVGWDRVTIERNGRRETLVLPADSPSPATPPLMATAPAQGEERSGVRQVAQDAFQIDRREVDQAMSDLNSLFTQARAVPYSTAEGTTQGFRLFSIKPQSLIDRIGLKNGDIIQRVNGVEISDPSTAFGLLQDLQGHPQVRVDVLRNHEPVTLSYEIR